MTPVCKLTELAEGRLTPAKMGAVPILVTLLAGKPVAVAARCPHQGAELSAGCVVGRVEACPTGELVVDLTRPVLRCPWHGFEYDLATGEPMVPSPAHRRMRLRTYALDIDGEDVVYAG